MNNKTKILLLITIIFIITISVVGLNMYKKNYEEPKSRSMEQNKIGDPSIYSEIKVFGGSMKEIISDTSAMGEIQTAFAKYRKGKISFDQESIQFKEALTKTSTFPNLALPGYLFDVGYDVSSRIKVYFHSNLEKTRTVVYRVTYGKFNNEVDKVYDGEYRVVVTFNEETPNDGILKLYNEDSSYVELDINETNF